MSTSSFHQKYLDNNKSIPDIQQRVPLSDAEIWGVVEHIPSTGAKIRTAMFVAGGAGTLYVLSKGLFMMGTNQKGSGSFLGYRVFAQGATLLMFAGAMMIPDF
eukprot:TRINITY_DN1408_c0_g1_i1.p2 TRINITY_DN1408_c0_g1~~TRINITY_DN1408_c0_g1_i1.p2  ORF type:complete len:103 (-),score=49.38 TRINITY_DN1408_c0_g1_i1:252-560(-)